MNGHILWVSIFYFILQYPCCYRNSNVQFYDLELYMYRSDLHLGHKYRDVE